MIDYCERGCCACGPSKRMRLQGKVMEAAADIALERLEGWLTDPEPALRNFAEAEMQRRAEMGQ